MIAIEDKLCGNTLIDNSVQGIYMRDVLKHFLMSEDFKTIKIATGFWDIPGMAEVKEELRNFLEREGTKLQLLIGKDPEVRVAQLEEPKYKNKDFPADFIRVDLEDLGNDLRPEYQEVVQLLLDYCKGDDPKFQIHIYPKDKNEHIFLHAKCYIATGNKGKSRGVIGSSNFTKKGLTENAELNYFEHAPHTVTAVPNEGSNTIGHIYWFDQKWTDSREWTKEFIEEVLKPSKIAQDLPKPEPQPEPVPEVTPLTPYEAYIHLLNDKFGAVSDTNMLGVLEKYLPKKYDKLQYQMDAVALCNQIMHVHGGFLLGDVVGLGKTVVGVLLIKYYLSIAESEGRTRKVLIITPPAIKSSWEKTIADFDQDQEDKVTSYVDFITTGSIDKVMEGATDEDETTGEFEGELKKEDYSLIIVDESHNFRNNATQMYEKLDNLIEEIFISSGHYPYIGLLSATLQNNRPEDLRNQIYLFQRKPNESTIQVLGGNLSHFFSGICDRYSAIIKQHPTGIDEIKANRSALIQLSSEVQNRVLSEILVRRTRTDIKNDYRENLHFPEIVGPCALEYKMNDRLAQLFYDTMRTIAPDEATILNNQGIVYMRYRATEYLKPEYLPRYTGKNMTPQKSAARLARIMQILLVKRLESSFSAFRDSLKNLQRYTRNMITMWENDCIFICPNIDVNKELHLEEKQKYDTSYTIQRCFDDVRAKIEKLNREGRNTKEQNAEYHRKDFNAHYIDYLKEDLMLIDWLVNRWMDERSDPKLRRFNKAIDTELFDPIKNPSGKLVVFSEAIATVDEIVDNLREAGKRVLKITAANRSQKEDVIRANFDANYKSEKANDYDAIVTTEVLAEGVNLHRANTIVNYDTPWNSTRLIQRIGRVNRIGSEASHVYVYNFMPSAEGDLMINLVQRASVKLQSFHTLFGEDSQIYTQDEEVTHTDYKKLMDDPETPFSKYISELQHYRDEQPERFEYITSVQAPVLSALQATDDMALFVIKTDKNNSNGLYVRVDNNGAEVIPALEMFELCQCAQDTPLHEYALGPAVQDKAIQAYNEYVTRIHRAAVGSNKNVTEAKVFIRNWISVPGMSEEAKDKLNLASRIIGKGNLALAKKIVKLSQAVGSTQLTITEQTAEDKIAFVNEIIMRELSALSKDMIAKHGTPYIYMAFNKVQ